MSQLPYRANLSAKSWPLISDFFGRSVIVGSASHDQNFNRQVYSAEDPDKDIGIPQIYYAHNVMPTSQGFQSIGYVQLIAPPRTLQDSFKNIFQLNYLEGSAYLTIHPSGRAFILQYGGSPQWIEINPITSIIDRIVTVVNVSGVSYVYISNVGCYKYSPGTNTLDPQTLTGLTPSDIIGITSSAGYLIAWDTQTIAWSSTIDPTDFTPSEITGAGGGSIQEAEGPLTLVVKNSTGFIVHTQKNAVAAIYSGNARFPFNYRTLASVGGITSYDSVAINSTDTSYFAYTTIGLQTVSPNNASLIFPEITDFLSGKLFEDFDTNTDTFVQTPVVSMKKKVSLVSSRYLVISYGIDSLTHAVVYDTGLKRFGKLKVSHVECFEWLLYPEEITEISKQSIGFIAQDGSVSRVDFTSDDVDSVHDGVMILGKYQYVRARTMQLNEVTVENIKTTANFSLQDMVSIKGKDIDTIVSGTIRNYSETSKSKTYNFRRDSVGINHSLLLKGSFYPVSLLLNFTIHGAR